MPHRTLTTKVLDASLVLVFGLGIDPLKASRVVKEPIAQVRTLPNVSNLPIMAERLRLRTASGRSLHRLPGQLDCFHRMTPASGSRRSYAIALSD